MKFEITDSVKGDWSRLSEGERRLFRGVLPTFNASCDRIAVDPTVRFPASLRVKDVENATGILEMTWSFSGPDGRATFRPAPQPSGRPATRAAPTVQPCATERRLSARSWADSPAIGGRHSISVRNSYSRNRRTTVSRS